MIDWNSDFSIWRVNEFLNDALAAFSIYECGSLFFSRGRCVVAEATDRMVAWFLPDVPQAAENRK